MKWFDKWFAKKCRQAWDAGAKEAAETMPVPIQKTYRIDSERTINLNITKANGGWVIEHRQHDKHRDRSNSNVHIITDDKDLGQEIGKIITFESLYK